LGAIIDGAAKQRISAIIGEAAAQGAALRLDGRLSPAPKGYESGHWLGPTVIDNAKEGMSCVETEIFGPVLTIMRCNSLAEALAKEARSPYGNATSVLVGDFLYSRSFQMMVSVGRPRVMEVLSDATNVIAEGEVLQLMNIHDPDITEDAYLDVIRYKTAKLFEAAGRLGAILADAVPAIESGLAAFGTHLGTAFQLIDDVLDYTGQTAETGKNLGDDLAEGKATLPLLHVIRNGSSEEAALVRRAIEQGGLTEFGPVLAAIERTGALAYARSVAQLESERAVAALDALEASTCRESLLHLASFAVTRTQ
jgi:octaprenyl-diphosphate synthase